MAIEYRCCCGKTLKIPDEHAGKKTKCPACGASFVIPKPDPKVEPPPGPHCPSCGASMQPGAVLCTACRFNTETGAKGTPQTDRPPTRARQPLPRRRYSIGVLSSLWPVVRVLLCGAALAGVVYLCYQFLWPHIAGTELAPRRAKAPDEKAKTAAVPRRSDRESVLKTRPGPDAKLPPAASSRPYRRKDVLEFLCRQEEAWVMDPFATSKKSRGADGKTKEVSLTAEQRSRLSAIAGRPDSPAERLAAMASITPLSVRASFTGDRPPRIQSVTAKFGPAQRWEDGIVQRRGAGSAKVRWHIYGAVRLAVAKGGEVLVVRVDGPAWQAREPEPVRPEPSKPGPTQPKTYAKDGTWKGRGVGYVQEIRFQVVGGGAKVKGLTVAFVQWMGAGSPVSRARFRGEYEIKNRTFTATSAHGHRVTGQFTGAAGASGAVALKVFGGALGEDTLRGTWRAKRAN